jgi:hypothetical protein
MHRLQNVSVFAAVLFLGFGAPAVAQEADRPASIYSAAREAVAGGQTTKSRMVGFTIVKDAFEDVPRDGAVLVGFDLGVGEFLDNDVIRSLRPIYRTARGEFVSKDFGSSDGQTRGAKKRVRRIEVTHSERLVARSGYAVAGVTLRTGLNIDGMSLTFMRIRGTALDPATSYTSDWVGNRTGGREETLSGNGAPVVGIFGNQDDNHVMALGLIYLKQAAPVAQAPVAEAPTASPREVRPPRPGVESAAGVSQVPAAAEPPELPAFRPPAAREPRADDEPAPVEPPEPFEPRSARESPPSGSGGTSSVLFIGLAILVVPAIAAVVLLIVRSGPASDDPRRTIAAARAQAAAAPSPLDKGNSFLPKQTPPPVPKPPTNTAAVSEPPPLPKPSGADTTPDDFTAIFDAKMSWK